MSENGSPRKLLEEEEQRQQIMASTTVRASPTSSNRRRRGLSPEKNKDVNVLISSLTIGLTKDHMTDVVLVGTDGKPVRACKFILACHSQVFEQMFYSESSDNSSHSNNDDNGKVTTVQVQNCNSSVLKVAVMYCITNEIPFDFVCKAMKTNPQSEAIARFLTQLEQFARSFSMYSLKEKAYWLARRLMNQCPQLACSMFDEISSCNNTSDEDKSETKTVKQRDDLEPNSIELYALNIIREDPESSLFPDTSDSNSEEMNNQNNKNGNTKVVDGGIGCMRNIPRIVKILRDQDMEVDEITMFRIMKFWADHSGVDQSKIIARDNFSTHIQLMYINKDLLDKEVRESGLFEDNDINDAISNQKGDVELVVVNGAGTPCVNGVYFKTYQQKRKELLFMKPAEKGYLDVGIYLYGTNSIDESDSYWQIAFYNPESGSGAMYRCPPLTIVNESQHDVSIIRSKKLPISGWKAVTGGAEDPPPTCRSIRMDDYNTRRDHKIKKGTTGKDRLLQNVEKKLTVDDTEKPNEVKTTVETI